jgi:hypothetical protein
MTNSLRTGKSEHLRYSHQLVSWAMFHRYVRLPEGNLGKGATVIPSFVDGHLVISEKSATMI